MVPSPNYYRSDMAHIYVSITGVTIDNISWDSAEGGDIQVESTGYNPGGMQPYVQLGGRRSRAPMTVKRIWSDTLINAYKALDAAAGITGASVSYQVLAADRSTPVGSPITYTGVLGPVTRPNYDSATSTPALLQIVIDLNEALA